VTSHAHGAPAMRQTDVAAPGGGLPSRLGRTRCSTGPQGNRFPVRTAMMQEGAASKTGAPACPSATCAVVSRRTD
jgi:hypothetical protein